MTAFVAIIAAAAAVRASADQPVRAATLDEAQRLFYSRRYDAAAALALAVRTATPDNLAASELRGSALHFQIRRILGTSENKTQAWAQCDPCEGLLSAFMAEVDHGRSAARAPASRARGSTTSSIRRFRAARGGCWAAPADSAGSTRFAKRRRRPRRPTSRRKRSSRSGIWRYASATSPTRSLSPARSHGTFPIIAS